MDWKPIPKSPEKWRVQPNFTDYAKVCADFSWEEVRQELDGLPGARGLNIAHEAVDRHASGERREHVALRWLGADGTRRHFTCGDLAARSNRFANVLRDLGIGRGDRIFALAGRIPEPYVAALGTLKNTSVFCPLFAAFGPEPIFQRLSRGDAKVALATLPKEDRTAPPASPAVAAHPAHRRRRGSRQRRLVAPETNGRRIRRVRDPDHRCRGHGAPPFHQRDDRHAEGRHPRPQRRAHALHDRQVRARSPRRRHLLVHRRSRLGDGHFLRNFRAASPRRDEFRR